MVKFHKICAHFEKKIPCFSGMSEEKIKKYEMSIFFPCRAQFLNVGGPRRPNNILRMPWWETIEFSCCDSFYSSNCQTKIFKLFDCNQIWVVRFIKLLSYCFPWTVCFHYLSNHRTYFVILIAYRVCLPWLPPPIKIISWRLHHPT